MSPEIIELYQDFIPKSEFYIIDKVAITYKEIEWLKFFSLLNLYWFKRYYLKITYKDQTSKLIPITIEQKDKLKHTITLFNFYASNLH